MKINNESSNNSGEKLLSSRLRLSRSSSQPRQRLSKTSNDINYALNNNDINYKKESSYSHAFNRSCSASKRIIEDVQFSTKSNSLFYPQTSKKIKRPSSANRIQQNRIIYSEHKSTLLHRLQPNLIESDYNHSKVSKTHSNQFQSLKSKCEKIVEIDEKSSNLDISLSRKISWKELNGSIPFYDDSAKEFTVHFMNRFETEYQKQKYLNMIEAMANHIATKRKEFIRLKGKIYIELKQDNPSSPQHSNEFKNTLRRGIYPSTNPNIWKSNLHANEFDKFIFRNKDWEKNWAQDSIFFIKETDDISASLEEWIKDKNKKLETNKVSLSIKSEIFNQNKPMIDWDLNIKYAIQLLATRYLLQGLESFEEETKCESRVSLIKFLFKQQIIEDDQTTMYKNILKFELSRIRINSLKKIDSIIESYLEFLIQGMNCNKLKEMSQLSPVQKQQTMSPKSNSQNNQYFQNKENYQKNKIKNIESIENEELNLNPWKKRIIHLSLKSLSLLNEAINSTINMDKKIKEKKLIFVPVIRREHTCGDLNVSRNILENGDTIVVIFGKEFQLPNRIPDINQILSILHYYRYILVENLDKMKAFSNLKNSVTKEDEWNKTHVNDLILANNFDPLLPNCYWSLALLDLKKNNYYQSALNYRLAASHLEKGNRIKSGLIYEASVNLIKWFAIEIEKNGGSITNITYEPDFEELHKKLISWQNLAKKFHSEAMEYFEANAPLYSTPILCQDYNFKIVENFLKFSEIVKEASINNKENNDNIIAQTIEKNTPVLFDTKLNRCHVCHMSGSQVTLRRCGGCKDNRILYCSEECQFVYWEVKHRFECPSQKM